MTTSQTAERRDDHCPDRDWRQRAACKHADRDCSFPVSASGPSLDQLTQAKAICADCPVRRQRLAFALDTRQDHGVWGGMSDSGTAEPADTAQLLSTLAREAAA